MAAASRDRWSLLWLLMLALGLRRGEALGLRWSDIDFDLGVVYVRQVVQRIRGTDEETGKRRTRLETKAPKSEKSVRALPLPPSLVEDLRAWRRRQRRMRVKAKVWLAADLVFTTTVGTAIEPRNVNRQWAKIRVAAGVDRPVRPHDLRHAWATLLLGRGVDIKTISAGLGHAQLSTTQRYVHVLDEKAREAALVMDAVLADLRARQDKKRRSS